jgi:pyridoxal phosphate enzyme (YggS family)
VIAERLAEVRGRIAEAARRAGRDPGSVALMAVTKGFPRETVEEALAAGLSLFGENRVQEAEEKYLGLAGPVELHLIGHLQRNKARTAAALFSCVQSIDKVETAVAVDTRAAEREKPVDILLELNTSGEASKSGFSSREELLYGLDAIVRLGFLRVRGLMTVGPHTEDAAKVRASFAQLRSLFEELRRGATIPRFDMLSMGMSGDFEPAIEEGSTLVRIGTALFGQRAPR